VSYLELKGFLFRCDAPGCTAMQETDSNIWPENWIEVWDHRLNKALHFHSYDHVIRWANSQASDDSHAQTVPGLRL